MKIIIAPDSFKDSLPARAAAAAMEIGIRRVMPDAECVQLPMADGGEGTLDVILKSGGGRRVYVNVAGPLGRKVKAGYGLLKKGDTAVIEMAAASGYTLVARHKRNPLRTSSYGTGEMILHAISKGARELIVGLGGSATVDGGAGMAQALGVRFRDERGRVIRQRGTGGMLDRIAAIDMHFLHPGIADIKIIAAADVENKLCGTHGAAREFGPQKGATSAMVKVLENNLRHFAGIIRKDLKLDVLTLRSGGSAGGLGAGLAAFAGAELASGVELIANYVGFESRAAGADLIITGEGRIDAQTRRGKVVAGVAAIGRLLNIPVIAIGGSLADDARGLYQSGVAGLAGSVARDMPLTEACAHARQLIADAAERTMRLLVLGKLLKKL